MWSQGDSFNVFNTQAKALVQKKFRITNRRQLAPLDKKSPKKCR